MIANNELEISSLAYDLWQRAGRPAGQYMEYRQKAKQEFIKGTIGGGNKSVTVESGQRDPSLSRFDKAASRSALTGRENGTVTKKPRAANESVRVARSAKHAVPDSSQKEASAKADGEDVKRLADVGSREEIARVAYRLWHRAGRPHGRYVEFLAKVERWVGPALPSGSTGDAGLQVATP
jgi:hypothetical protein